MRPIDADKLIDDINVVCFVTSRDNANVVADAFNEFIKQINEAPTIKTKKVNYFDEDELVWKTGEVIVE